MELKKCIRCGSFYISEASVCQNCLPKDKQDIAKLQGFISENGVNLSKQQISMSTGISTKNLNRYLQTDEFKDLDLEVDYSKNTDIAGNLSTNL